MSAEPDARIATADLLRTTWRTLPTTSGTLLIIAGLGVSPATALAHMGPSIAISWLQPTMLLFVWIAGVCSAQVGITHVVVEVLAGRPRPTAMEVLGVAASKILVVIPVVLLATAATACGLVFAVFPGVILWLTFFVAVPVAVVEHRAPIASLRRSAELTRGSRFGLFLAATVVVVVFAGWSCGAAGVEALFLGREAEQSDPGLVTILLNLTGQVLLVVGLSTLAAVYFARAKQARDSRGGERESGDATADDAIALPRPD